MSAPARTAADLGRAAAIKAGFTAVFGTAAFVVVVSLPLYGAGMLFFRWAVVKTRSARPQQLFGVSFAISVALLLLVLLEVTGILAARTRWLLWRVHLLADLALLVLLLPYVLLCLALRRAFPALAAAQARAFAVAPLGLWLWFFYKVGEPFPVMERDWAATAAGLWVIPALCLSRAGVIGVSVTAVLSGFGAVSGPANSLRRLITPVDRAELEDAKRMVIQQLQLLAKHRLRCVAYSRRMDATQQRYAESRETATSLLGRLLATLPLNLRSRSYREVAAELRQAHAEDASLRHGLREQLSGLEQMADDCKQLAFSRTARGRVYNLLGYVFSAYCVYKMAMSTRSILLAPSSDRKAAGIDPVTRALGIAISLLQGKGYQLVEAARGRLAASTLETLHEDAAFWSQTISLVLVGLMIVSSVRGFLLQANKLGLKVEERRQRLQQRGETSPDGVNARPRGFPASPASPGAALPASLAAGADEPPPAPPSVAEIVGCAAAHVMGFYLLSSVLLMRASLPSEYRHGITEAVGAPLEFAFYHHFSDSIFITSASITLGGLVLQRALRAQVRRRSLASLGMQKQSSGLLRRNHYAAQASAQRRASAAGGLEEWPSPGMARSPQGVRQRPVGNAKNLAASPPPSPFTASPFRLDFGAAASPIRADGADSDSLTDGSQGGKEAQDATASLASAAAAAAEKGAESLVAFVLGQLAEYEARPLGESPLGVAREAAEKR